MRWLRSRRFALSAGIFLATPMILTIAAGWYLSGLLQEQALRAYHKADAPDLVATLTGDHKVRLSPAPGRSPGSSWQTSGTFGLVWDGGYGQVTDIVERGSDFVVRIFKPIAGSLGTDVSARIDGLAFPTDPMVGLGLPFEDTQVAGPDGPLPAWYIDAPGDNWAILVHGQNATRREMLRILPEIHGAGLKALVVTYRNDEGAPASADHLLHYGETEWRDIDAAANYAFAHGASRLVLIGNSMGGAIVMSWLHNSEHAGDVSAVILDAPVLNFDATVRFRAPGYAPGFVISMGEWIASWRFDVHWDKVDYLRYANELEAPILIFHGTADTHTPIDASEKLSAMRPDIVTLVRTDGAGHVRSWNADPMTYEAAVREFLAAEARP